MKDRVEEIQIRIIDQTKYKETHGLFINGRLHHTGTENECTFLKLKFSGEAKIRQNEIRKDIY